MTHKVPDEDPTIPGDDDDGPDRPRYDDFFPEEPAFKRWIKFGAFVAIAAVAVAVIFFFA